MKTVSDPETPETLSTDEELRSAFLARYGLSFDPFSRASGFFYDGARRGHSLKTLQHLAAFGDRVLWVSGPPGVGKTRLVSEFCVREKDLLDIRLLEARTLVSVDALGAALQALSQQRSEGGQFEGAGSVPAFFQWSENLPTRGRRLVLILDDADKVPPEVLATLVEGFARSNRGSAAVPVVIASGSAGRTFADCQDQELLSWIHEIELPLLTPGEIGDFLDQAFVHAGGKSVSEAGKRALSELQATSGGNIGVLQHRAPALLLGLPAAGAGSRKSRPLSWRWAAGLGVLLVASFLLISLQYRDQPSRHQARQQSSSPAREMIHISLQQPQQTDARQSEEQALPVPVRSSKPTHTGVGLPLPAGNTSGAMVAGMSGRAPVTTQVTTNVSAAPGSVPGKPVSPTESGHAGGPAAAGARLSASGVSSGPAVTGSSSGPSERPEKADLVQTQSTSSAPVGMGAAEAAVSSTPSAPVPAPRVQGSDKKVTESPDKVAGGFTAAVPEKYTQVSRLDREGGFIVQVSGNHDERYAIATLRQYPSVSLRYTRTTYQGKPWFVVFMGPYPNADKARKGIESLPDRLRRAGPWVRKARGL